MLSLIVSIAPMLLGSLSSTALTAMQSAPRSTPPETRTLATTLLWIEDVRIAGDDGSIEDRYAGSRYEPGLRLIFDVILPDDRHLLALRQPVRLVSTDSTGENLVGDLPAWHAADQRLSFDRPRLGQPQRRIALHLASPQRAARHLSVQARFDAVTYRGTRAVTLDLDDRWTTLSPSILALAGDAGPVRVRLAPGGRGLEVEPAVALARLDGVEFLVDDGRMVPAGGWYTDLHTVTFAAGESLEDETAVRLHIRTGIATFPCEIRLDALPLP